MNLIFTLKMIVENELGKRKTFFGFIRLEKAYNG